MARWVLATLSVLVLVTFGATAAAAVAKPGEGQLLSPTGKVFPLERTDVRVEVSGPVARVVVRQTFQNPFEEAIEAIYVFPLPDRAAVDDMTIEIGPRRIRGQIERRAEAEKIYEKAKKEGKTAALLTQERPNIFTQNVANILPGERIVVEIRYAETLPYEKGGYTLVFPMVVGPRFNPDGAVPDADRIPSEPGEFLKPGERSGHDITLAVALDAGVPVEKLASPSHTIDVARSGASRAAVAIHPADRIPNKDFVLAWKVAGEKPRAALLAHRTDVGGFFTLMIQPEEEPAESVVMPREIFLVVDCSGSMGGMPIETAKAVVRKTLRTLGPADTFQILRFSQYASGLSPNPLPVTPENVERGLAYIDAMHGGGGTHMIKGIQASLAGKRDPGRMRVIHFLTDGYIGNEKQILEEIGKLLAGARIFPLGVGSAPNSYLIDRMSRAGRGAAAYIRQGASEERIAKEVERFVERVRQPTLVDLEIDWAGLPVKAIIPATLPDLFVGQPVVVHGIFDHAGDGEIVLRGRRGGRPYEQRVRVVLPEREERNGALAGLWARAKITEMTLAAGRQVAKDVEERITNLALEFRLMSAYTAFVAVEESIVVEGGAKKVVRQPVPLPEGTQWKGFFGDFFSDAPFDGPSTNAAIGLGGGAGGSFRGRRGLRAEGGGGTQTAVDLGLEWLKNHQDADGSWAGGDIEATGWSLMAFLGAGETHKTGHYRDTVKRSLVSLKRSQDPRGAFVGKSGLDLRAHAVATLAMSEAWRLTGSPLFKSSAQMAVDFLVSSRRKDSGWGRGEAGDVETTLWAMAALRSARISKLRVDGSATKGAMAFLDSLKSPDHRAAVLAWLARLLGGQKIPTPPDPTRWGEGRFDPVYGYAASVAAFRTGGDVWKSWNKKIKTEIVDRQVKEPKERGSWAPVGAAGGVRERVIATALGQLAAEVYYRYTRVYGIR